MQNRFFTISGLFFALIDFGECDTGGPCGERSPRGGQEQAAATALEGSRRKLNF